MIYVFVLIVILLFFVYNYRKSQRRKPRPFPGHWHELAMAYVVYYRNLPGNKQMLFQRRMMEFLSEVYIEGVRLELQDLDKVLIV